MSTCRNTTRNSIVPAAALALFFALRLQAATVTMNPSADAFVTTGPSGSLSANNYGGAGALSVAAPGLARGEFQSLLRFDLSAARTAFNTLFGAGQWTVQSISLSLSATPPNNAIFNSPSAGQFGVSWMQNDSWVEGSGNPNTPATTGITYSSLPSFTGAGDEALGTFSFDGSTSGSATYSLGLASGFAADAAAGNLVSLRLFAADSAVSYLCDSRNFGTASLRPILTIAAVPEPGAFSLLATGAVLLLGGRWRRPRLNA
jgi:hypothetical protein